jgi:6-phosphogluconolactonase
MAIKTISNPNQALLFAALADDLLRFLAETREASIPIALPGGRSVVGLLRPFLAGLSNLSDEIRAKLHFFMLDERCVPLESPESNFKMLNEQIFVSAVAEGLLVKSQLHPFDISTGGTLSEVAADYFATLSNFGGYFKAAVLGVGEDAHVGSLFPNHHSVMDESSGFITMEDSPKPPPIRMSASRRLLEQTEFGLALFLGEAKRDAYNRFNDNLSVQQCPVSILRSFRMGTVGTDL